MKNASSILFLNAQDTGYGVLKESTKSFPAKILPKGWLGSTIPLAPVCDLHVQLLSMGSEYG